MKALFALLILVPLAVHAQIYKWVDEKGRVQYGEKPPAGAKASPLKPEAMPGGPPRPPPDLAGQETDFRRRQIQKRQDEEKLERETQVRRGNCDSARERLALAERAKLYRREGGEKVYYSEAEHSAALERLRGLVSKYCG